MSIIAAERLNTWDAVYNERPFVKVLRRKYKNALCEFCHGGLLSTATCRCQAVKYCSLYCQKLDLADHALECYLTNLPKENEDVVRLLGRVILKLKGKDWKDVKTNVLGLVDVSFADLKEELGEDDQYCQEFFYVKQLYHNLKCYLGEEIVPAESEALSIIKKVKTNAMQESVEDNFKGYYLFIGVATFPTECIPNTNVGIFQNSLKMWALRDIRVDEKITITSRINYSTRAVPIDRKHYPCTCTDCRKPYQDSVLRRVRDETKAYCVISESIKLINTPTDYRITFPARLSERMEEMIERQKHILSDSHILHLKLLTEKCFRVGDRCDIKYLEQLKDAVRNVYGEEYLQLEDIYYMLGSQYKKAGMLQKSREYFSKQQKIMEHRNKTFR